MFRHEILDNTPPIELWGSVTYCSSAWKAQRLFPLCCFPGNLKGEEGAADRTVEDVFLRRFMFGTFHGCLANEVVIKRRGNLLVVCALMLQKMPPQKFYFLIGYSESLLSHFYKCPVKLELQTLQEKAVYKYLWWDCGVLVCT